MTTVTLSTQPISGAPIWAHPDYARRIGEWQLIRDCVEGETAIKDARDKYLPSMANMDSTEYNSFLDRATFFNMVHRTVTALVGTMFRRAPITKNLPESLAKKTLNITKDRQSLFTLAKSLGQQIVTTGRVAGMVDLPNEEQQIPTPFIATYIAENVLDWDETEIDGRNELSRVVLREFKVYRAAFGEARKFYPIYRVLKLDYIFDDSVKKFDWVYTQEIYDAGPDAEPDLSGKPKDTIRPNMRGKSFNRIPFIFFGPFTTSTTVERSPVLDIAQLNISHYRSYALLEHGRFFTGLPIYYCSGLDGTSRGEYTIGPSVVWETGASEKPGIIEFNGQGLKFLENALDQKEQHISTLGGRMLGVRSTAVAESDNMVRLKERNEQSLLLNVVNSLSEGLTYLIRWWALASDTPRDKAEAIEIEINKDFLFDQSGAREFRAIHAMYKDGVISVEILYDYLRRADVIPDYIDLKEFKRQLENIKNFPGQPDAVARMAGYPDSRTQLADDLAYETLEVDTQIERERMRSSEKQARDRPAPTPPSG